jgi:predicted nucleotidyltransferase
VTRTLDDILRPPTEEEVETAVRRFAADLTAHYGARLRGLYLFGSRARGDHEPDSDVDIIVLLEDGDWRFFREKMDIAGIATDTIIETGVHVQGWPVSCAVWENPEAHTNPMLIHNMRRDAKPIERPA